MGASSNASSARTSAAGNTVIEAADHIVDVGPGAGSGGGTIVFEGTYEKLLKSDTPTASRSHARGAAAVPSWQPPAARTSPPIGSIPYGPYLNICFPRRAPRASTSIRTPTPPMARSSSSPPPAAASRPSISLLAICRCTTRSWPRAPAHRACSLSSTPELASSRRFFASTSGSGICSSRPPIQTHHVLPRGRLARGGSHLDDPR